VTPLGVWVKKRSRCFANNGDTTLPLLFKIVTPTPYSKEERKLRIALGELINTVRKFEDALDALMKTPYEDRVKRGKDVALLLNGLTFANDQALYFGLHFDHHKDKRDKQGNAKAIEKWSRKMW
jgi:hypothetical protein